MRTILLTGSTGLIGKKLGIALVSAGYAVRVISRNTRKAQGTLPFPAEVVEWDLNQKYTGDTEKLKCDAVIHLAGESVAERRWTPDQKEKILASRIDSTRNLIEALNSVHLVSGVAPRQWISASAIGFYPYSAGNHWVNESAMPGEHFLSQVVQAWEEESKDATRLCEQVAQIRIGVVLDRMAGALAKMLPVFESGIGGTIGTGQQWMSWVHVDDLVEMFLFLLKKPSFSGVFNGVAPHPVTNREFSHTLAKILQQPCIINTPGIALKLALGQMSEIVLEGHRVQPKRFLEQGFRYRFSHLEEALEDLLTPQPVANNSAEAPYSVFETLQWIPQPVEAVFDFFSKPENLQKITPEWLSFEILKTSPPPIHPGSTIEYRIKLHGIPLRWKTKITSWSPNRHFTDNQESGPYKLWNHTHFFSALHGGTLVRDLVLYRLPLGKIGYWAGSMYSRKEVQSIFDHRRQKISEILSGSLHLHTD